MIDPVDTTAQSENTHEEMTALYEETMKSLQEGGSILQGRVIEIGSDTVIIDVGLKSEGKVLINEFMNRDGELTVAVGDEVEVMIVGREKQFGLLLLSKQRVDSIKTWQKIKKAFEEGTPIEGTIVSDVKGGFIVDIGVKAFLPISQVDVKPVKNPASFVGRHLKYKVIKVNQHKNNVVISRRTLIEEERERKRVEFWKNVKDGQTVYGIVRNILESGAFIDLGGVDGFLPVAEVTWGRITHPKEYLRVGDEVKVKIVEIDRENEKTTVSIKELKSDPWVKIEERYPVKSKVRGKVVGIVDYGAFVELEQGVEGLLHISEMSYDKKLRNPNKIVKKGDWIDLLVLDIDTEKKRISLGLKQLLEDPWDALAKKYDIGSVVKGKVKNFTDFGMFLGVEDGIDGLVHMSEISWSRRKKVVSDTYRKGMMVEARVLSVDKKQKKFSLSIKRMHEDPWKGIASRYQKDSVVNGYVTSITDFGVFVEIEEGVEGLIHLSEMEGLQGKHPSEVFQLDDQIQTVVLSIDENDRRIALSVKAIKKNEEKTTIESYRNSDTTLSTLGDILEPAMKEMNSDTDQ